MRVTVIIICNLEIFYIIFMLNVWNVSLHFKNTGWRWRLATLPSSSIFLFMRIDIPWYEWLYTMDYTTNSVYKWSRLLKCYQHVTWHLQIWLTKNKKRKTFWFHQLVMLHKTWECPEWMEVCHNDGNPENNYPDNLRYDTRSENQKDKYRHGYISYFKISNPNLQKWWENRNSKIVYQYSLDGKFIQKFGWVREASIHTSVPHINISQCARWLRKRAWQYIWSYNYFE